MAVCQESWRAACFFASLRGLKGVIFLNIFQSSACRFRHVKQKQKSPNVHI